MTAGTFQTPFGQTPMSRLPRVWELVAVIATVCAFSFNAGFIYPVISLALEARGFDEAAVGFSAAASGVGIIAAAPIIPRIVARFGGFALLAGSTAMSVLVLLLFPVFESYEAWVALRFLLGVGTTGLFAAGEAWVNALAEPKTRGRTIAIYTAAIAASFSLGPFSVMLTGFTGWLPFLVAAGAILACFIPVLPFRRHDRLADEPGVEKGQLLPVMRHAALLMLVVMLFGILDGTNLGLMPVYAIAYGMTPENASLPLAAMGLGVIVMQWPIGYLADKMRKTLLLAWVLGLTVILSLMMPLVGVKGVGAFLYLMLWGGISFSPYTLALSIVGERYRGSKLAAASAGFALTWGLGAAIGPYAIGYGMEEFGAVALPFGIAFAFSFATIAALMDRVAAAAPEPSTDRVQ